MSKEKKEDGLAESLDVDDEINYLGMILCCVPE